MARKVVVPLVVTQYLTMRRIHSVKWSQIRFAASHHIKDMFAKKKINDVLFDIEYASFQQKEANVHFQPSTSITNFAQRNQPTNTLQRHASPKTLYPYYSNSSAISEPSNAGSNPSPASYQIDLGSPTYT